MEGQAQQTLLVATVDRVGELEEQLLVAGRPLVGERPDRGGVLLDDEQQVAAVVGIGQGDRPVEPQVREGDLGRRAGSDWVAFFLGSGLFGLGPRRRCHDQDGEGDQRRKKDKRPVGGVSDFESMTVGILSIPSIGSE